MHIKKRERVLQDRVKQEERLAKKDNKRLKTGERCHYFTVALLWLTVFGYIVVVGMCLLYVIG